jgi:hypothetical protein
MRLAALPGIFNWDILSPAEAAAGSSNTFSCLGITGFWQVNNLLKNQCTPPSITHIHPSLPGEAAKRER